ncbi:MAG: phosphatidate cytidylyltransferase [Henriciella sp.]|nr:phosphatidate cytidylyltransferase [Henriciella sp.]
MAAAKSGGSRRSELTLRLLSALILIPFGLYVVWSGGLALAIGCGLFAAIMAYEWVRMSASPAMKSMVTLSVLPIIAVHFIGLAAGGVALAVCTVLAALSHPLASERRMSGFGLLYTSGMALALYVLREGGDWSGQSAALITMGIVWGSDSAAYFSGKGFGGPPLTPESPSKTWSGALGAVIFSALCGALAARIMQGDITVWILTGIIISIFAQMGDLMESILKRRFGVKDSSGLVPGHGGVLDRVDGLGIVCGVMVFGFVGLPTLVEKLGFAG